jgi:hypothetical protein
VERPEEYKWSSYRGYTGREKNKYIDKKEIRKLMGMRDKEYERFVMSG